MSTIGSTSVGTRVSISREGFDQLFASVSNWGRWGQDDQRGTLNLITPERVLSASRLVQRGRPVSLSNVLSKAADIDNPKPMLHYMSRLTLGVPGEPTMNEDFVGLDYHGKLVTHVDAICHVAYRGRLYNDVVALEAVTATGARFAAVTAFENGIVGRGVLLDMPRHLGVEWVEPGPGLVPEQLEAAAASQRVAIGEGDVLLVRTGHAVRRAKLGPWNPDETSAGLDLSCFPWLRARGVAVLGSDADTDARPSAVVDVHTPAHVLAVTAMGMPLLDNMNLDTVAQVCADENRWEFLLTTAPLRLPGGTGSPINPLAIF
jgi:kynurenine formamidase